MPDDLVIVPSKGEGFVDLARTKTGRLFRKHLLSYGDLRHPTTGATITVDDTFANKLKANFDAGVCDIVQVPLANDQNQHSEDPQRNIGEVVDVEVKDRKVYAVIDVRDAAHADRMGKTYLGASAMMHLDYTDTKSGTKVGPTLLHACVTNRPYVTGLESYKEIVAATSDTSQRAVLLTTDVVQTPAPTEETTDMPEDTTTAADTTPTPAKPSLDDMLAALKTDHGIDVSTLQAKAAEGDQAASLSKALVDALTTSGVVKLAAGEDKDKVSTEDVVGAVAELANSNVALTGRVHSLERDKAESEVSGLIAEGRVMPAQKAGFVELKLTNPAMFDQLVPAEPIIKMSTESGVTPPKDDAHVKDVDAEIARLSQLLGPVTQK
jgi:PBP1b-binding outer membrane lipoprotein LpoB